MANELSTSEKLQKENISNIWKIICMDFLILNIILSALNIEKFMSLLLSKSNVVPLIRPLNSVL